MSHVSYSEIKIWHECPYKHKLQYIDRIAGFKGNLHTAFGTAIHSVCEHGLLDENLDRDAHFLEEFAKEVASLEEKEVVIEDGLDCSCLRDQETQQGKLKHKWCVNETVHCSKT